ncbi:MAG TPA: urate oxidase [Lacipirellulaceae bacterium]|nr:urate oxidase [Lacipirellulaceae bacterium]
MPHKVWTQSYGKSRVRVTKVLRDSAVHEVVELSVDVDLDGDFTAAYTAGDNSMVIPTDTMKNTVYAFARELDVRDVETFAWTLGNHFVENFDHVAQAMVRVTERPWQRLESGGNWHPHAFTGSSTERATCHALVNRAAQGEPEGTIECGLQGLVLLKTTASGFAKFLRDEFTTLKETDDRIFATDLTAAWSYNDTPDDWRGIRRRIRAKLIHEFAARFSPSVQATLYEMCAGVLDAEPAVEEISLSMPNLHRNLIDLSPFDLDNPNVLFVPTDEPHGSISASVCRERDGHERGHT